MEAQDVFNAKGRAIDVLVSDVDMPGLDGISLALHVRSGNPSIPIVLMSGFSDQLEKASALSQQRVVSISKPFTLDQIKQAVRKLLA